MIAQSVLEPLGLKFGFKILPHHDTVDTDDSIFDESKDFSNVQKWKKLL